MEQDWIKIFSSSRYHQVQFVKAMLEENNIKSVEMNKKDSSYNFGEVELYVNSNDELKAHYLIRQHNL